ncbi:MAG: triose-phosphate isomerase [Firmicutes bacterium]|nr:triose-phosphate isomerase [Bacillota bacterium]
MVAKRSLIVANWKMYKTVLESVAYAKELMRQMESAGAPATDQVICPTIPALHEVKRRLSGTSIRVGAQNLDLGREGANTGAVSAYLVREAGADCVILGHSERRSLYGEDDALVADKTRAALQAHLLPIVCVGESHQERLEGETDAVIRRQIGAVLRVLDDESPSDLIFAYEPLWAIGTGLVPEPEEANRVAAVVHDTVRAERPQFDSVVRILYGGSVNPGNVAGFAAQPLLDGALVGGASLAVDQWMLLNQRWGEVRS